LDAKEKDAEKISAKLAMKNDTSFVIGHLSTTASANALPNYLNADPPIPVILPNETNPELLPPDFRINYLPVFRLSPTDNKQAEKAADFIVDQGAENIWVVQDVVISPVYSAYLAQEFISQIHEKNQLREARQIYESQLQIYESQLNEGRQAYEKSHLLEKRQAREKSQLHEKRQAYEMKASKVLLWTTNLEPPSADVVKELGIDWVLFAGSSSNCLIITRQVKAIWKDQPHKPKVLLTSSCANLELLRQGGRGYHASIFDTSDAGQRFQQRRL
jgi:branched-chain amino acid transport system substrate-binding protein